MSSSLVVGYKALEAGLAPARLRDDWEVLPALVFENHVLKALMELYRASKLKQGEDWL